MAAGEISTDLVAAMTPWLTTDYVTYLEATASMFEEVWAIAGDEAILVFLDPDLCPAVALPYLAQFVGERLPVGISEAGAREWIKDRPNSRRGTVGSIVGVARRSLTGSRVVALRERDGDSDHLAIRTIVEQTPDPARTKADLLRDAIPGDLVLDYGVFTGATLGDVAAGYASLTAVDAANDTLADVLATLVGYVIYSDPFP